MLSDFFQIQRSLYNKIVRTYFTKSCHEIFIPITVSAHFILQQPRNI